MIYIKPSFYNKFKCIAANCTDNCCIGWEIDVDESTLYSYEQITGDFGERLRENLVKSADGSACFRLCKNERCTFLNENNLCDIIINCGEESLCEICKEHPRFYEWFPGVTECGLGLCCEEVCRLLLENDRMFTLEESNDGEKIEFNSKEDVYESDFYIFIVGLRDDFFKILSNKALSFEEKLVKILEKTERFTGESCRLKNDKALVELYLQTEPVDSVWTEYINDLNEKLDDVLEIEKAFYSSACNNFLYAKVLAYMLYRHLIKGVFDKCIAERVCFCIESLRFVMLSDMKTFYETNKLDIADRVNNLKRWSKQIEYSEENTDLLIYGSEENGN